MRQCQHNSLPQLHSPSPSRFNWKSELMALYTACRSVESLSKVEKQVPDRTILVVAYTYSDSPSANLIKYTAPTIPDMGYWCRESITEGIIHSIWLITVVLNPSDALRKNPSKGFSQSYPTKIPRDRYTSHTGQKSIHVEKCPFRHSNWIPTSKVAIPGDDYRKKTNKKLRNYSQHTGNYFQITYD